ncbi:MAG TPA: DUF4203 domain-containing protein, partial [Acidimicrobiales bacterium]|nr:DUF4203 domain-containing protein [Acidimicrobiales bacterium]
LALAVGALFALRGYLTMRLVIPVWGAFTGFVVGAAAIGAVTGDGLLGGLASWLGGVAVAALFGVLVYTYYEVSVLIGMGAIGFALGSSLMVALDVSWAWAIVLGGLVAGTLLAFVAIVADVPMVLLTVLTAMAGATASVTGVMLLVGALDASDLESVSVADRIQEAPGWWLLYVAIALVGVVAQLRTLDSLQGGLRGRWASDGGRQVRSS